MFVEIGLLSILAGAGVACASERFPAYIEPLEIGAGFLLIFGFALLSHALPPIL
jgi:hypothetical protein